MHRNERSCGNQLYDTEIVGVAGFFLRTGGKSCGSAPKSCFVSFSCGCFCGGCAASGLLINGICFLLHFLAVPGGCIISGILSQLKFIEVYRFFQCVAAAGFQIGNQIDQRF